MSVASRIAQRRKELQLTQQELAERLEVSFQAVSSWESGKYLPESSRLHAVAKALSVSLSWLLEEENAMEVPWDLSENLVSAEKMRNFVHFSAKAKGMPQTLKALRQAEEAFEGRFRKGVNPPPYIVHPLEMACHAFALGLDEDELIAAILLHDVIEDCPVTPDELGMSPSVREAVLAVTFDKNGPLPKAEAKRRYYEAISKDRLASLVKVIDRCNNVSAMATAFSREKMAEYITETETYILPILNNLKHSYPEYSNAVFLIKYQLRSVIETIKHMM